MPPARPPSLVRRERSLHLTNSAERLQWRGYRFPPIRCRSTQGFFGSPHVSQVRRRVAVRPKGMFLSHHVPTNQGTCFSLFDPLTEDHLLFHQKEKDKLIVRCVLWDFPMRGGCAQPHTFSMDPNRAKHFPTKACPTSVAPCLSPLGHRKNNSTTGLEPTVSLETASPHTSKHCSEPQLGP